MVISMKSDSHAFSTYHFLSMIEGLTSKLPLISWYHDRRLTFKSNFSSLSNVVRYVHIFVLKIGCAFSITKANYSIKNLNRNTIDLKRLNRIEHHSLFPIRIFVLFGGWAILYCVDCWMANALLYLLMLEVVVSFRVIFSTSGNCKKLQ